MAIPNPPLIPVGLVGVVVAGLVGLGLVLVLAVLVVLVVPVGPVLAGLVGGPGVAVAVRSRVHVSSPRVGPGRRDEVTLER